MRLEKMFRRASEDKLPDCIRRAIEFSRTAMAGRQDTLCSREGAIGRPMRNFS